MDLTVQNKNLKICGKVMKSELEEGQESIISHTVAHTLPSPDNYDEYRKEKNHDLLFACLCHYQLEFEKYGCEPICWQKNRLEIET
jgi:hypothetical protein